MKQSSFLFFQGSFNTRIHKHSDDLSFVWQESGDDILIDSGKYGYNKDKYRDYFLSTSAHNTISVDNKDISRDSRDAYGSALIGDPICMNGIWFIKGCIEQSKNKYIHKRLLLFIPGEELYVVDCIKNRGAEMGRDIANWWHFGTDSDIYGLPQGKCESFTCKVFTGKKSMKMSSYASEGNLTVDSYKGQDGTNLAGWVSRSYQKYEPSLCIKVNSTLQNEQVILTTFTLGVEDPVPLVFFEGGKLISNNKSVMKEINEELISIS